MEKIDIKFDDICALVDELNNQIDFEYDYIVGVGRGGFIPATLLAYKQDKKVLSFGVSTYDDLDLSNLGREIIYQPLFIPNNCKKLLVVDDICDSGNTFDIIKNTYSKDIELVFASLYVKEFSKHKVNYYSTIAENGIWLNFPWE